MSHHEMWRDELGIWIHITDATSFTDLLAALDYGGHPILWPLLLIPLNYLFSEPWAMQVLHALIASSSVYLLLRFAPFSLPIKLLISSSYLFAFEYAVVSRQYALIVLAMFALLSFRKHYPQNLIVPALLMVMMAETSVHGLIIAIAVALALLWDNVGRVRHSTTQLVWGTCIIVVGLSVATIDMMPPSAYGFARGWFWELDDQKFLGVLSTLLHAYFPIGAHHWDTNSFVPEPGYLAAAICVAVVTIAVIALRKHTVALTFFLIATTGLLTFSYVKYFGSLRHHGMLFLVLISAFWLLLDDQFRSKASSGFANLILYPALIIQVYTCVWVSYVDWSTPFSGARAVAQYIRQQGLTDHPLIGHGAHPMSGISWELNKPIYLLQMEEKSRRVIWDVRFDRKLSKTQIMTEAQKYTDRVGRPTLLILNNEKDELQQPLTEFRYLDKVPDRAMVMTETFYLYELYPRVQHNNIHGILRRY